MDHIKREMIAGEIENVAELFDSCLDVSYYIPLWEIYMSYMEENFDTERVTEAYKKAIDSIGLDIGADDIWIGYIKHLIEHYNGEDKHDFIKNLFVKALIRPSLKIDALLELLDTYKKENNIEEDMLVNVGTIL